MRDRNKNKGPILFKSINLVEKVKSDINIYVVIRSLKGELLYFERTQTEKGLTVMDLWFQRLDPDPET